MSDANEIIWSKYRTTGGARFRCSRRTEAHIDATIAELEKQFPDARLEIIQGCFHDGPLSAETHDYDAVLDFRIIGLSWWEAQRFLREQGWAAWYRHTGTWASPRAWHLHAISLGYTTRVGVLVPAQVDDYRRHSLGLKGQHSSGADHSWFPPNIDATVFDFAAWERELDMPLTDEEIDRIAEAVAKRPIKALGGMQLSAAVAAIAKAVGAK